MTCPETLPPKYPRDDSEEGAWGEDPLHHIYCPLSSVSALRPWEVFRVSVGAPELFLCFRVGA